MQVVWLPQPTCDFIDWMTRNILWKGNSNCGVHLSYWNKIYKDNLDDIYNVQDGYN